MVGVFDWVSGQITLCQYFCGVLSITQNHLRRFGFDLSSSNIMQSRKMSSLLRLFSSLHFRENFQDMEHRYSELCIDELNRQILQIDFSTSFKYPMYGADLAALGAGITDFLNDKNHPAVFASCTSNGINRVYYRAYVTHKRYFSDPEVSQKQKKADLKPKASSPTENIPQASVTIQPVLPQTAVEQDPPVKDAEPAFEKIMKQSRVPGDRSGLGFVPSTIPEEQVPTPPPQPITLPPVDPELKSKFDKLNLKAYAMEQEIVNLKSSLVDKDIEIKTLASGVSSQPEMIKFDALDTSVLNRVRRVVARTRPPIFSERAFVQHNIGRTALEIALDTYYTCEFYGLRDILLDCIKHIMESIVFPDSAEECARLCFSIIFPHVKFLMKREEEMGHKRNR